MECSCKGFCYLQFLQWRLLKSRQPRSLSVPSCFDHRNKIGRKCWVTADTVEDDLKITTTKLMTQPRLDDNQFDMRRNKDWMVMDIMKDEMIQVIMLNYNEAKNTMTLTG